MELVGGAPSRGFPQQFQALLRPGDVLQYGDTSHIDSIHHTMLVVKAGTRKSGTLVQHTGHIPRLGFDWLENVSLPGLGGEAHTWAWRPRPYFEDWADDDTRPFEKAMP